jgi:hypothetical protein
MAKVVWVLYDDPVDGYPSSYPRDDQGARKQNDALDEAVDALLVWR